MYRVVLTAVVVLLTTPALAESIEKPKVVAGDTWTYRSTMEQGPGAHQNHNEITVIRAGASDILIGIKEVGSTMPPREQLVGSDWSRFRSVNGANTVVNQPLNFPLSPGKSWMIEFKDDHPTNRAHQSERFKEKFAVSGWEDVTVPAGTFKALKIECEGEWTADLAPDIATAARTRTDAQGSTVVMQTNKVTPQTITGRLYKAFWYVPETKRTVKSVEEDFNPSGARVARGTEELESYKVSP